MLKTTSTLLLLVLLSATAVLGQDDYTRDTSTEFQLELEPKEHGGYFSLGVSLLGWGLAGLELKAKPINWLAIEGGVTYRPTLLATQNNFGGQATLTVLHGAAFHLGPTFYFSRKFNSKNTKVLAHGLFIKGGYSSGTFKEALFALGWSRERYLKNRPGNSYTFQLGAGFTQLLSSSIAIDSYGNIPGSLISPTLFFKFKWDFYIVYYQR